MTCTKVRYTSRRAARSSRRTINASGRADDLHTRPYFCPDCRFWHLGRLPRSVIAGDVTRAEAYPS